MLNRPEASTCLQPYRFVEARHRFEKIINMSLLIVRLISSFLIMRSFTEGISAAGSTPDTPNWEISEKSYDTP